MTSALDLHIEHIRSFASKVTAPIRPITLLVGENSSGKSTFLAAAACVFNPDASPLKPHFNEPPYSLGNYETIATYKAGRYGRDTAFSMGFQFTDQSASQKRTVIMTYGPEHGMPALNKYEDTSNSMKLSLSLKDNDVSGSLDLLVFGSEIRMQFDSELAAESGRLLDVLRNTNIRKNPSPFFYAVFQGQAKSKKLFPGPFWNRTNLIEPFESTFSIAPIRTKPRRTYDELTEDYSPEGEHIPSLLSRLLGEQSSTESSHLIKNALVKFGKESGLFSDFDIKKLGKSASSPFQLRVKTGGPSANLVDVGYGVSQALPVIVQSVLRQRRTLLLIQQPEVHLHPRAQAALGTFFADLAAKGENSFIIETHSDHLVDRVRQEVRSGTIAADRVQILFFHRPRGESIVHPISIDDEGNIIDAPEEYRSFFLEEELKLFS